MRNRNTLEFLGIWERHYNPAFKPVMVEGASIGKQAHAMDTERWMLDTIEFDRAVARVRAFAEARGDTLVIVTADHECSGAALTREVHCCWPAVSPV